MLQDGNACFPSPPFYRRLLPLRVLGGDRDDVAAVLARCLSMPEAAGKTFEVLSLPGLDRVSHCSILSLVYR